MTGPYKTASVILAATLVIIAGMFVFIVLLPLPLLYSGFFPLHDPDAICLYPQPDELTMNTIWDTIVGRTGIDPSSAAIENMQIRLSRDQTIENLALSFYAKSHGENRRFSVYLRYDPDRCGTLSIHSYPAELPDFALEDPVSPEELLHELPQIAPGIFGIANQTVLITTGVTRETNVTFYSMPCTNLFLLKNGTVLPLDQAVFHDTQYQANRWTIIPQRCTDIPDSGRNCISENSIIVFSDARIKSADFVRNIPDDSGNITLYECPHSPVQVQSCRTTFWGTSCTNWTVY